MLRKSRKLAQNLLDNPPAGERMERSTRIAGPAVPSFLVHSESLKEADHAAGERYFTPPLTLPYCTHLLNGLHTHWGLAPISQGVGVGFWGAPI